MDRQDSHAILTRNLPFSWDSYAYVDILYLLSWSESIKESTMETNERSNTEIRKYCTTIRKLLVHQEFDECEQLTIKMMGKYPHNPEPHNIYGIILEKRGNHLLGLKHFRAALSLDPSFKPAMRNLETYGTLFGHGRFVLDESDFEGEQIQKKKPGVIKSSRTPESEGNL